MGCAAHRGRLLIQEAWPTTWKQEWDPGGGGAACLGRALTWEGGTRSKFFPSILRMCFRAWEVIWCLRRKENWQPSRMQWKWLFTWLYLQPVDTALGREPPASHSPGTYPVLALFWARGSVAHKARACGERALSPWWHS